MAYAAARRRALLAASGGLGLAALCGRARGNTPAVRQRVVVLGAGWAGLACAYALRRAAPGLDVHVFDREPVFRSLPLSNAWLVGRTPERIAQFPVADIARRQGWRFTAAAVTAIDRAKRVVHTTAGAVDYDWLVVATGAVTDLRGWFGGDAEAAARALARYTPGFVAAELDTCKRGLDAFAAAGGGTLVMTVPPAPYRCPPAPYERAALLGWWIRSRKLKAKLVLLDAAGGMPRFNRLFAERYGSQIEHRTYVTVRAIDAEARSIATDDGDLRFDHAMLLGPMSAGPLAAQAGLLGHDAQGASTRWLAVDPTTLRSPHDERVYVVGDGMDSVSQLFGPYPKTAHIAADLGAAAASVLAAASRGDAKPPAALLPRSQCHVWLDAEPQEQMQLDASFRLRGDGVITQTVRQFDNPQPRDEDLQWAKDVLAQRLGLGG